MAKKTVGQIDVRSKRVLVRVDFNVPLGEDGRVTDDRRVRQALPTIRSVVEGGGRCVLMSHLGRPKGDGPDARFSLALVARRLSGLVGKPVRMAPDCVGPEVSGQVAGLKDGEVCLLENLRFHPAETIKDKDAALDPELKERKLAFARKLAELADVYVNDAFGTCHRDNASMLTVPQLMSGKPRVVGFLVEKELKFLGDALRRPARPFVVLLGGAKVSDKIPLIDALVERCDAILIGGAMAYTFLRADGLSVGDSLVEPERMEEARRIRQAAGAKLHLPLDSVTAEQLKAGTLTTVCERAIPTGRAGYDIGPQTVRAYTELIAGARTIFWNGPMGVFETPPFDAGTLAVARAVADATEDGAVSIIGGGDSAAAVDAAGLDERMTHISTGGGAALEFLEGKPFAAIEVLDEA